jgi:predicted HicB family RNase H-like nuclease
VALTIGDVQMVKREQTVTSLRVDPELWKEAKVQAIKHDITLAEAIEEALREWIKKKEAEKT